MGRAASVWAGSGTQVSNGSSQISNSNIDDLATGDRPISGELVRLGKVPLPKLRESIRRDVADLFWRTFEGTSLNAKCDDAVSKVPGVSANTFARIAGKETEKVEYGIVAAMLYWHQVKHGKLPPLPGLVARAQIGGAK